MRRTARTQKVTSRSVDGRKMTVAEALDKELHERQRGDELEDAPELVRGRMRRTNFVVGVQAKGRGNRQRQRQAQHDRYPSDRRG